MAEAYSLNLPNQITIARLIISILVFIAIPMQWYTAALVAFCLAAGTDWLDGYLARKYNLVTKLGRILDPFADKLLICGVYVFLAAVPDSQIAPWMAVVVLARELLVTTLRSFMEQAGTDFSAKMAGKLKMVFQCVAVILSLSLLITTSKASTPDWLPTATLAAAWLSVLSTVYSGIGYLLIARKLV